MPEREIGGDFHFSLPSHSADYSDEWQALLPPGRRFYMTSGRAALRSIARVLALNPTTPVLLPVYGCPEILTPFREMGAPIVYYPVGEDLRINAEEIKKRCPRYAKAILIIHYFGFQQDVSEIIAFCRRKEIFVIEDLAQSFMSTSEGMPFGRFADFTINSLRKMLPVPDGATLTAADEQYARMVEVNRSVHAFMFGISRSYAMALKGAYEYVPTSQLKRLSRYWFNLAEDYLVRDREPAMISPLSRLIMSRLNPNEIITARRQNYLILLNALQGLEKVRPLFPVLPEGVCPLGFPIVSQSRDALRDALTNERVYPPVHWALDPSVSAKKFPAAKRLSRNILTLPCDQRYNAEDMRRIIDIVRRFEETPEALKSAD